MTPRARSSDGPALETSVATLAAALHCPAAMDDPDHEPVLLVHGTFSDDESGWGWNYRPALTSLGFDVCTVTLPDHSLGDMQIQAEYVVFAIRTIASTSGDKVDVIGASQGTLHPRWAVKWWPDVRTSVDDMVSLAGPHHGTDATRLGSSFDRCFASCWQMATGSNYLKALNAGDETPGEIAYTSIYTLFDEMVIPQAPTSTSTLEGASNFLIQDLCPGRPTDHAGLSTADAVGFALALDALTHAGGAAASRFDMTTCLLASMEGAEPAGLGGSADFQGEYLDREPALKPYARASQSGEPSGGTDDEPGIGDGDTAPQAGSSAPEPSNQETQVGDGGTGTASAGSLPSSGGNVLRLVASALLLIAAGGSLLQTRSSRRADLRTLPASSRRGSVTNS